MGAVNLKEGSFVCSFLSYIGSFLGSLNSYISQ